MRSWGEFTCLGPPLAWRPQRTAGNHSILYWAEQKNYRAPCIIQLRILPPFKFIPPLYPMLNDSCMYMTLKVTLVHRLMASSMQR